jgi:hypothetical protein
MLRRHRIVVPLLKKLPNRPSIVLDPDLEDTEP